MRISDWSSDVCSSDLPYRRRPLRIRPNRNPTNGRLISFTATVSRTMLFACWSVFARFHQSIALIGVDPVDIADDAGDHLVAATTNGDFKLGYTVFDDLHRSRSEEHTSELQSLMRISYAVFCLKQKI